MSFKIPEGVSSSPPNLEGKTSFEILMINLVDLIKGHMWIALATLLFIHWSVSNALKKQPQSLWNSEPLKISEMYIYPIKSLRGMKVATALATKNGFQFDRTFMLLQVTPEGYKNMAVARYHEMVQFLTHITLPNSENKGQGSVTVTWEPENKKVDFPLQPDTSDLDSIEVSLHSSAAKAYKMPAEYSDWFSKCFGFEVALVYLGDGLRDVLMDGLQPGEKGLKSEGHQITFADCAPYLVVSKTSLGDVSSRLPEGEDMDMTKFRPNIILSGAEKAWEEDFWGRLRINDVDLNCEHNCARCASINIDYETGKQGTGESGQMLKKLQKDRRVDVGSKWSPVFGRYCYWSPKSAPAIFQVGDDAMVTKLNTERTKFKWNGTIG